MPVPVPQLLWLIAWRREGRAGSPAGAWSQWAATAAATHGVCKRLWQIVPAGRQDANLAGYNTQFSLPALARKAPDGWGGGGVVVRPPANPSGSHRVPM